MRFSIICLASFLLVPAFGAFLNKGKQPDRGSPSPPPEYIPLHTYPSPSRRLTHTFTPPQHPPPTHLRFEPALPPNVIRPDSHPPRQMHTYPPPQPPPKENKTPVINKPARMLGSNSKSWVQGLINQMKDESEGS